MSLFVEVDCVEKDCKVILNLDHVAEIAPLREGGCAIFMIDSAGVNSKNAMRVKNAYDDFKQFVMQTVSAEDIARRFPKQVPNEQLALVPPKAVQKAPDKAKKVDTSGMVTTADLGMTTPKL